MIQKEPTSYKIAFVDQKNYEKLLRVAKLMDGNNIPYSDLAMALPQIVERFSESDLLFLNTTVPNDGFKLPDEVRRKRLIGKEIPHLSVLHNSGLVNRYEQTIYTGSNEHWAFIPTDSIKSRRYKKRIEDQIAHQKG